MTLLAARSRAAEAIGAAVEPHVEVVQIDGVLSTDEIGQRSIHPPCVAVSILGRDEDGIRVVAYVATNTEVPSSDDALQLLDTVEEAMRTLLGRGRPLLDVRTQTLYDPRATRDDKPALWGVSVSMPYLVGDAPEGADDGLLAALDALLGQYLAWTWASTEIERARLLLDGPLPFALVTYGGGDETIEPAGSAVYRYERDGAVYERNIRGRRTVTAVVEFLGRTEEEAEAALQALLSGLPRRWTYLGAQLPVTVRKVVGAHWRRKEGAHSTVAEVRLQAVAPAGEEELVGYARKRHVGPAPEQE